MHLEYALQVAAYAHAYQARRKKEKNSSSHGFCFLSFFVFQEMTGQSVSEGWIVRFDKNVRKAPQVKVVVDLRDSFETFLAAKKLWTFLDQPTSKHLT